MPGMSQTASGPGACPAPVQRRCKTSAGKADLMLVAINSIELEGAMRRGTERHPHDQWRCRRAGNHVDAIPAQLKLARVSVQGLAASCRRLAG